jgi:hypothetical protein
VIVRYRRRQACAFPGDEWCDNARKFGSRRTRMAGLLEPMRSAPFPQGLDRFEQLSQRDVYK